MDYQNFRKEHLTHYLNYADTLSQDFTDRLLSELDAQYDENMSAFAMKSLQYRMISEAVSPVLFRTNPFYFETGALHARSDGSPNYRGRIQAGGWTMARRKHLAEVFAPDTLERRWIHGNHQLYLICGIFMDNSQHFKLNYAPILKGGLKSLYDKATAQLDGANNEEREYLEATRTGLMAIKRIGEKFAEAAIARMPEAQDEEECRNLRRISDTAARVPWEAPQSFYEALNTLAFLRKAIGTIEGAGFNTFGRVDIELLPFYEHDIASGKLTREDALDLITRFLLMFDCHYDHDSKMVGYSDHELENTYVIGGCDADGQPVFNELTRLFLQAARDEVIIYPKIMCRYSESSPKEYLDLINESIIRGTTTILYHNDDACIPALLREGRTLTEARDYISAGCWGMEVNSVEKPDNGNYVNILKAFEYSVHCAEREMAEIGIRFLPIDDAQSFEDVYAITCENVRRLFEARAAIGREGKGYWSRIVPVPLVSAAMESCLDKRMDLTAGGAKYHDEEFHLVGFPNVVDSLLAIRKLCFEDSICTLDELLSAVRRNWEGAEHLRAAAIHSPCWGDGSDASNTLARRFNDDMYRMAQELPPTVWGGKTEIGHLTYTEIRFWAEKTRATPDGRHDGEYFSQGLTPSRLHKIGSVFEVLDSFSALDPSKMAGSSVVNIILPGGKIGMEHCEAFVRAAARSGIQSLQLNCVSREQLCDAQLHPENHRNLIVRVCGFSARFTSLSPEWQAEVLSRNFYE
ncbi:MAG: hypothetical protein E7632_06295 [Ruminococcaceae bacterium]|nr:hypothetical protein [Oscillospiraceae bacterium]